MWFRIILPGVLLSSIAAAAPPTDAELLKWVREREKTLECVTPLPESYEPPDLPCSVGVDPGDKPPLPGGGGTAPTAPGGPKTKTESPHGTRLLVYANEPAVLPLFDPWGKFPEGGLLLKEKLDATGKTELFTGMWKREAGFFPASNDWEFFETDAAATRIVARGKIASCASCHQDFKQGDQVSRAYLMPGQLTGGRIILHSNKAKVTGTKLHYETAEKKNTLGFWVNAADRASWSFEVQRPGTFEIHIWQGCGKGSGGSEVAVTSAGQTTTFTVEDTGHFQNFKERVIGRVTYKGAGPQTLEVAPRTKPGAAVMDLRQIILVPVKDAP